MIKKKRAIPIYDTNFDSETELKTGMVWLAK